MFWPEPFKASASREACRDAWGITPRNPLWADVQWGGRRIAAGSNIVFTNGALDPWHGGGVLDSLSDTLVAVIIPEVGGWVVKG
jgi:lysosomal Pro-X carboxypeptidase